MLFSSSFPFSEQKVYIYIDYHWANRSSLWIFSSSYLKFKPQIFPFTPNNVTANSIAPKYKKLNSGKTRVTKLLNIIAGHQWRLGATEVAETPSDKRLFPTVLQCKASHYLWVLTEGTSPRRSTRIPEITFNLYSYYIYNRKKLLETEITVKHYLAIYCISSTSVLSVLCINYQNLHPNASTIPSLLSCTDTLCTCMALRFVVL